MIKTNLKSVVTASVLFATILFVSPTVYALTIDVAPGVSPNGYVPLSLFGPPIMTADDQYQNYSLGSFDYIYAGETWDTVGVSTNGFAVAGASLGGSFFGNSQLPNTSAPNNTLAPFWTDLNPTVAGGVYAGILTGGGDTWLVLDWNGIPLFGGNPAETYSFEIWIGLDGVEDITFAYGDLLGTPTSLTIGAEDKTGTVGESYYFNGSGILPTSQSALRVTSTGAPVGAPVPEPSTFLLLGGGLAGLAFVARRRKKE